MIYRGTIFILILCLTSCGIFHKNTIAPKREFRGIWIATVANIDWPKDENDNLEKQQADFINILDFYKELNFNAVVVQIRTAGDAFYPTDLAPWSQYLTGKEGQAPKPYYDPLEWMIDESHKRGFEFHAWLNPYRATFDLDTIKLSSNHDFYTHRDWMIKYGKKYYYDPGLPEVQQHLIDVMQEVVDNYEVDAIHFDDYFYPYKIENESFDDSISFKKYALKDQDIEDWRRANVDSLVKGIHTSIKTNKPWIQFGISPFGVWRNKSQDPRGPDTKASQTNYDDLYADPISWMENGWIDYIVPQLYWSMDYDRASHSKLLEWWSHNSPNTRLYIGNGPYKIRNNADKAWDNELEIPNQIKLARQTKNVEGNVFFSAKSLMYKHQDVVKILKNEIYPYPALTPKTPSRVTNELIEPELIEINQENTNLNLKVRIRENETIDDIVIYSSKSRSKIRKDPAKYLIGNFRIGENEIFEININNELDDNRIIALSSLDKYGTESKLNYYKLDTENLTFKQIPSRDE